jgi:hypothetical protein
VFVRHFRDCSLCWYDFWTVPFPQVVGVHLGDDLPHFFVDYALDFGFLGFPFGGDDAEVMVAEGAEGEEGSVAVVVVVEEVHHGSLVVVVVRCSLAGQCRRVS